MRSYWHSRYRRVRLRWSADGASIARLCRWLWARQAWRSWRSGLPSRAGISLRRRLPCPAACCWQVRILPIGAIGGVSRLLLCLDRCIRHIRAKKRSRSGSTSGREPTHYKRGGSKAWAVPSPCYSRGMSVGIFGGSSWPCGLKGRGLLWRLFHRGYEGLRFSVEGFAGGHGRAVQGLAARSPMARSR